MNVDTFGYQRRARIVFLTPNPFKGYFLQSEIKLPKVLVPLKRPLVCRKLLGASLNLLEELVKGAACALEVKYTLLKVF